MFQPAQSEAPVGRSAYPAAMAASVEAMRQFAVQIANR